MSLLKLLLIIGGIGYLVIGVLVTAFCVHMSYHEAAVGFGDSDDAKAQKVLESPIGPLAMLFLFFCWPVAILVALAANRDRTIEESHAAHVFDSPDGKLSDATAASQADKP